MAGTRVSLDAMVYGFLRGVGGGQGTSNGIESAASANEPKPTDEPSRQTLGKQAATRAFVPAPSADRASAEEN